MTHQEHIAKVITAILALPKDTIRAYKRGNPFDKLLRSYDEFSADGIPLYRKKVGNKHYRMSVKAYQSGLLYSNEKALFGEHKIPLSIIKEQLLNSDGLYETVLSILSSNEVVIITQDEERKLNGSILNEGLGLKSKLPPDNSCRLLFSEIIIAPETEDNHL